MAILSVLLGVTYLLSSNSLLLLLFSIVVVFLLFLVLLRALYCCAPHGRRVNFPSLVRPNIFPLPSLARYTFHDVCNVPRRAHTKQHRSSRIPSTFCCCWCCCCRHHNTTASEEIVPLMTLLDGKICPKIHNTCWV